MSELREVLLCEDCQGRHDEQCDVQGCECWCREPSIWDDPAFLLTGAIVLDLFRLFVEKQKEISP